MIRIDCKTKIGETPKGLFWIASKAFVVGSQAVFLFLFLAGCSPAGDSSKTVVLYCAQDQVIAEPILANFTKLTGIQVRAIYDSEAVKTVGLANRLLAEQEHPRCDLFWGNEEFRTRLLGARGVWRETNGWEAFGQRRRRLIYNTQKLTAAAAPKSLIELTNSQWRGKVSIAFPQFGTTATHFLALRQAWGEKDWNQWMTALAANHPFIEEGNSWVAQRVGRGEALVGITDSDDLYAARQEGLPLADVTSDEWLLKIPNTVGRVRSAPHPAAADSLADYIKGSDSINRMISAGALQRADAGAARGPGQLSPDWDALVKDVDNGTADIGKIFAR